MNSLAERGFSWARKACVMRNILKLLTLSAAAVSLAGCAYGGLGGLRLRPTATAIRLTATARHMATARASASASATARAMARLRLRRLRLRLWLALRLWLWLATATAAITARLITAGTTIAIIRAPASTSTTAIAAAGVDRRPAPLLDATQQARYQRPRGKARPATAAGRDQLERASRRDRVERRDAHRSGPSRRGSAARSARDRGAERARTTERASARPSEPRARRAPRPPRPQFETKLLAAAASGRRRISTIEVKVITGSPCWLVTVVSVRNEPISGFERDGVFSMILPRDGQRVAGIDRLAPAQFVDPGRAEPGCSSSTT